jgi:hypothetical protein
VTVTKVLLKKIYIISYPTSTRRLPIIELNL